MKKTSFLLLAILLSLTVFSSNSKKENRSIIQRAVLDVGATPFQINISDVGTLKSANFAIGYEIIRKLDLRFNVDLNTYFDQNPIGIFSEKEYVMMTGLSLGINYNILENLIIGNSSLDLLGKFGVDLNDDSEQESVFYDLSARLKFRDISYIGIGYNHHMFGSIINTDMKGIYFTFGIEF